MNRFDRGDEGTDANIMGSERLQAFTKAMWDALVPRSGECVSVQGELIRVNERLQSEYFRNGLGNYYSQFIDSRARAEKLEESLYGRLFVFMLDTLIANRNGALDPDDVAYFEAARRIAEPDWRRNLRMSELEEKINGEEAAEAEILELAQLEQAEPKLEWEALFRRAERCIANWCIANPELVDREGRPVEERGVRRVEDIVEPAPPPPPCPLCKGRGWISPSDATQFPEMCSCKRAEPAPPAMKS